MQNLPAWARSCFDQLYGFCQYLCNTLLPGQAMEYLPNVAFAMLLGVILGLERRRKHKTAGVRTMMVICGASALITCIGVEISQRIAGVDPTRIAASLLQSIAFIGAGVILTRGIATQGVTTAATILFAVGVGETCGFGMYGLAFAGTLLMIVGLVITGRLFTGSSEQCHPLTLTCRAGHQEAILARFGPNYELHGFRKHNDGDLIEFCIHPQINVAKYEELVKRLMDDPNVIKVHAENDGH